MRKTLESLALLAVLALGSTAWAAGKAKPMDQAAYAAEKTRIEAQYKVDSKACAKLKGQRADVCDAEAEGRRDSLAAELEARFKPSPEAWLEAKNVTAEANYDVAKARCDALKGKAEDRCVKQAKAAREAAVRQAKVEKVQETGGAFANRARGKDS